MRVDAQALVGVALTEASVPSNGDASEVGACVGDGKLMSPLDSQKSWLNKQMLDGEADEDPAQAPKSSKLKFKLRAAVHAVKITNKNVRRFSDGGFHGVRCPARGVAAVFRCHWR